jgi:hypothetical protein
LFGICIERSKKVPLKPTLLLGVPAVVEVNPSLLASKSNPVSSFIISMT